MKLYNYIEKAIREHAERIAINDNVQESDVRHAIRWVMRNNPDIFWFAHQYHIDNEKRIISFHYQFSHERSELIQDRISDVVKNDFQIEYARTLDIYCKVMYVYKWLLSYCNYNINSAYNQSIYSVFVQRNSVCTGYAKAAQYLFNLLGIESCLVFGRLNNDKKDGRHCWNLVCIDGVYYHLDICLGYIALEGILVKSGVTNTLRYGDFNYNCFCVSTVEIIKTRIIEDLESLPICDKSLDTQNIERLSGIKLKERTSNLGCLLSHIGSSADIHLCSKDKKIVLKKFRDSLSKQCAEEYNFMDDLRGCKHLLQLNDTYTHVNNNIIAIEQSTPIVDLFCSHYYHPTLYGLLSLIQDIIYGWQECYERGIMYRDFHVCNIYKADNGVYKLGDFGSCAYKQQGKRERVGNIWFMSPETYSNGIFDERSAVYSITAILYFIMNGMRPPFVDGNNEKEALQRKMKGEALPEPALLCSLPKEMAEAIMVELFARGCAFYPAKRLQTCKELLHIIDVLRSALKNQSIVLQFVQQNPETILANPTVSNVYIPWDIHHRFAYSEEVERKAMTSAPFIRMPDDVENYCRTMGGGSSWIEPFDINRCDTFEPAPNDTNIKPKKVVPSNGDIEMNDSAIGSAFSSIIDFISGIGVIGRLFAGKTSNKTKHQDTSLNLDNVYSSIFAPAEVKRKSRMLVQVYLHLFEETEKVKKLAKESQKDAERRDYIPLQCQLKKGDKVDVLLNIYGETLLLSDRKSMVWQGSFTKCSFDYMVPQDIDVDELSCTAVLTVYTIPVGEMRFITRIVDAPRQLNPEVIAHKYHKVFISYAHNDEAKVKSFHEGLKLCGIEHFFDRDYLEIGAVFPEEIQNYINSADLFVLFWSKHAAQSEYVEKERELALQLAFPQVKPQEAAKLSIYPMSIEPRAELPDDMKDIYHFGII